MMQHAARLEAAEAVDTGEGERVKGKRESHRRLPVVRCPVCNHRAYARTSEEVTPIVRYIRYCCSNIDCSMAWVGELQVIRIISPSGISPDFRPPNVKESKPPGHAFGQTLSAPLLDYLAAVTPPT